MRLTQPCNPFFHRVQIVADRTALAHFPLAPFLRHRRDDTVLVDIQSKIEFFFHSLASVILRLQCGDEERHNRLKREVTVSKTVATGHTRLTSTLQKRSKIGD